MREKGKIRSELIFRMCLQLLKEKNQRKFVQPCTTKRNCECCKTVQMILYKTSKIKFLSLEKLYKFHNFI